MNIKRIVIVLICIFTGLSICSCGNKGESEEIAEIAVSEAFPSQQDVEEVTDEDQEDNSIDGIASIPGDTEDDNDAGASANITGDEFSFSIGEFQHLVSEGLSSNYVSGVGTNNEGTYCVAIARSKNQNDILCKILFSADEEMVKDDQATGIDTLFLTITGETEDVTWIMDAVIAACDPSLPESDRIDVAITLLQDALTNNDSDILAGHVEINGIQYNLVYSGGWIMTIMPSGSSEIDEITTNDTSVSITEETFNTMMALTKSDIRWNGAGIANYHNLYLVDDDSDWLDNPLNTKGSVKPGVVYRALAQYIDQYEMGEYWTSYAELIIGFVPDSEEEFASYIDNAKTFIMLNDSAFDTMKALMTKISTVSVADGTFDFENNSYDVTINNLTSCADEMQISEEMLGYILAMTTEAGTTVEFSGNSCHIVYADPRYR